MIPLIYGPGEIRWTPRYWAETTHGVDVLLLKSKRDPWENKKRRGTGVPENSRWGWNLLRKLLAAKLLIPRCSEWDSHPKTSERNPGMNPYESSPAKCREDKLEVGPFFSERAHTTLKWIWNPSFKQFTFYDISRVAKTGWRWENQRCTFVLGEDILVHPWRTSANCDLFECYFCVLEMHDTHFWHFFGVFVGGTVCAKAQPKKQGKRAI